MLLNITTVEEHDAGVELIREGDHETDFYVVLEGRLEVTRHGHELAQLTEGDHCGEMELIMARSRSATVTTLTKSRFLVVQRADFIALLKAHEHLGVKLLWSFLQTMSLRLHHSNTQLSNTQDDDEAPPIS